ncbi:MAG: hypothetical protein IKO10_11145 [Lachnospiraceae bacterium]|nr:hypothetical protein [Lachnospiraceae bacterium]
MEKSLFDEMVHNVELIDHGIDLASKKIFLFGHCNATLELIDLLEKKGLKTTAILDNSAAKQGQEYKGAVVVLPNRIMTMAGKKTEADSVVLITSRFYASMLQQLRELGYEGPVRKVIDYNTYAEYSLSDDTVARMKERENHGERLLERVSAKFDHHFKVLCPFNALGDIYFMMSYWPAYAKKRNIDQVVFCVPSNVLADVIHMFGDYLVEVLKQNELDAMIQAVIYTKDESCFIAHQDRPYVVNLSKVLYKKRIPLEQIYCCGVYGLPVNTRPVKPNANKHIYKDIQSIPEGKAVVFSPYAKSVTSIDRKVWEEAVNYYVSAGYKCYTNVVGDEKALDKTEAISPSLLELKSVVERAGTFVGIRSGLCDILREANAKKIALYPDYNYCDTKWKSIEMYYIEQFEYNLLATEVIEWEKL